MEKHGWGIISRIKTEDRMEKQAEEKMRVYTDPSMTAGRPTTTTTTRGSSFFCVSLKWTMKGGEIRSKNKKA